MPDTSLDTFYAALAAQAGTTTDALRPTDEHLALGHFNIFDVAEVLRHPPPPAVLPLTFDRRTYYKISLIAGSGRAAYATQELTIRAYSLWFAPHSYQSTGSRMPRLAWGTFAYSRPNFYGPPRSPAPGSSCRSYSPAASRYWT